MMKTNIINSLMRMKKLTVFYLLFFLTIAVSLTYVGCSEVENNLTPAPDLGVHPTGWADTSSADAISSPNFHGKYIYNNNAWNLTQCKSCHGGDYKGGVTGSSCLTCHTSSGGPQNCRLCHGGASGHSNPPSALNGSNEISALGVGVHVYHLDSTKYSAPVECNECHLPLEGGFNSPNHLGENPDGIAEIVFGTLAKTPTPGVTPDPVWNRETATCSNVYCHGDFEIGNNNAAPVWTDPNTVKCGSCHGNPETGNPNPRPGGEYSHWEGLQITNCYVCHGTVINPQGVIYNKELHVNGQTNYRPDYMKFAK